ncbi:hypothetical protein L7F22_027398 [Adiantum nelumboides]|nr:hypothetical protein [Adiantum nelumboides]
MPFPVVFTGGINPLLWRPSVAFGAFDQPTYLVDITPFLGQLTDDAEHEIQLKVVSAEESQEIDASWFVSGNVQVFLDKSDTRTTGRITSYNAPTAGNFSTAGYVKGNVSEDGTLRAEVRLDSPRRLSIEAELRTGSSEEDIAVSWSQSADFYSITTQQGPSSTTDQEAKGSHQSFHGKDLYLQYGFDFPIKISLYQTKDVINATINHAYNVTQQFHDNATLEPSFFRLTTEQKAEASVTLKDGQSTAGDGTTLTILDYSDDLGNTFGRRNIGHNRSVESDLFYGSLASKAGRVK